MSYNNYGYGINGAIEQLDYTVHLTVNDHEECVRFFAEHPVYGTVGYASYEDAEDDYCGFLGFGQFLDTCESMVNAGYNGDEFYFDAQDMLVKVRCDYWGWTWMPETGLVYDPEPEPEYPNRKQRRAARRVQNKHHKVSDRKHGKRHGKKYLDSLPRKKHLEADNYDHPTFKIKKGKLRSIHDIKREREIARIHDVLDVSPVERLTASVLAEVKQYHGIVGCTWNVFDLSEIICQREQLPYPDSVYVCEQGNNVQMVLEYFDSYDDEYPTHEYINLR